MTPFGLFGVLVLVFGFVQSKISLEDRLLSDVDVKNLLQRLAVLEESLIVEKERNDRLEKTVNVLATNLEQTKRMFVEECTGPRKEPQDHQGEETKLSLFGSSEGIARKTQKRKTDVSKINHSAAASGILQKIYSTNSEKRLLVQPSQVIPTPVAFYAQRSSSIEASEVTANLVIVFDVVKTNAGNGYHPSTGIFIVPESGMYVFSWSFQNGNNVHDSTQLMVNNNEEGLIHLHTSAGNWITGTGVAVLHVNKGDDVYVRITSLSHTGGIISNSFGRSSFTGWKLN
ncbi:uncharacterized protein LOC144626557 [Crassostrea virginica]